MVLKNARVLMNYHPLDTNSTQDALQMYIICSYVVGYCTENWEDHHHSSCWGSEKKGNEDSGCSIYMLMRMGAAFLKRD